MFKGLFIIENDNIIYSLALQQNIFNVGYDYYYDFLKTSADWEERHDSEMIFDVIAGNVCLYYKYIQNYNLILVIIVDLYNKGEQIFREVSSILEDKSLDLLKDDARFKTFTQLFLTFQEHIPIKISLVGFGGVGKTTILKLLKEQELPTTHNPTILADITQYNLNGIHFNFWDFAGQVAYKNVWPKLINKSDLVIVVTDSSQKNVSLSKFFLDLILNIVPYSKKIIIANKQDTPNAIDVPRINQILGENTIPFVAIDPNYRSILLENIFNALNLITEGEQIVIQSNY